MKAEIVLLLFYFIGVAYTGSEFCPIGYYKGGYDNSCYICRTGKFCKGDNKQIPCPKGYYTETRGSTNCTICPIGHNCYYTDYAAPCFKGQFQKGKGARFCYWCPEGHYTEKTGSTICKPCPVGHSCLKVADLPIPCLKGWYQDKTAKKWCVKCPVGTYQNEIGSITCSNCTIGQYNTHLNSSSCKGCPTGHKCPSTDKLPVPCNNDEYSTGNSAECFSCPSTYFCPSVHHEAVAVSTNEELQHRLHEAATYTSKAFTNKASDFVTPLIDMDKNVHGFVEYHDNKIYVSFGCKSNVNDWIKKPSFSSKEYLSCDGCTVLNSSLYAYDKVRFQIISRVSYFYHAYPYPKVIVTGHSLGGAIATLAAAELAKSGYNVDLITFGSPRVGNNLFAEYVNDLVSSSNYRVTYKNDVVTVNPPQARAYWHVGTEIHYTDVNTMFELPNNIDVEYKRHSTNDNDFKKYLACNLF